MTAADVDLVTELVAAGELHIDGEVEIEREDILVDWGRPGFDLATDSIGVFDADRLLAEAEVFKGTRAEVNVHPDARGGGLGVSLLGWTEAVALERAAERVGQTISDHDEAAHALLMARGYEERHTSWILEIEVPDRPEDGSLPEGIAFADYDPAVHAPLVYRVVEDAFNEWPNRDPATFDEWANMTIRRPSFAPWQMLLAVEEATGDVVGAAFTLEYDAEGGWVQQLATRASHRHRGIARALLQRALRINWDRGERKVGLNTDSRTGALGLYEKVGMSVKRSYTHRSKPLR
jgi:GNAT superfamily N-acetyltransferase